MEKSEYPLTYMVGFEADMDCRGVEVGVMGNMEDVTYMKASKISVGDLTSNICDWSIKRCSDLHEKRDIETIYVNKWP